MSVTLHTWERGGLIFVHPGNPEDFQISLHSLLHPSERPSIHAAILLFSCCPFLISCQGFSQSNTKGASERGCRGVRSNHVCSSDVSCDVSPCVLCSLVISPVVTWGFNAQFVAKIREAVVNRVWICLQNPACQVHNGLDKRCYPFHRGFMPTGPLWGGQVWFRNFCLCLS